MRKLQMMLVVMGMATAACDTSLGGGATGATCSNDETLTWADFGQDFMNQYCVGCHRQYSTLAGVKRNATLIDHYAGSGPTRTNQLMPQSGAFPSLEERQALADWIACGLP